MKACLKKLLAVAAAACLAVGILPAQAADAQGVSEGEAAVGMTQEKIDAANDAYNDADAKLEFLTMSDTEFGFPAGETVEEIQQKLYESNNYLYERIRAWAEEKNFTIQAVMDNGDVIGGNESEYYDCLAGNQTRVQAAYLAIEQVFTENFGDDTIVMLSSGNHDIADVMGDTLDTIHQDDGIWYYGDSEMNYVGNFHVNVNGYDFITLDYNGTSTFGYGGQQSGYQDFLRETLQEIASAADYDPTKPIFVQAHSGYAGTSLGGQWAGVYDTMGPDVQTILADYPQAVLFSAHTHFPVEEETAIYQKNFTFVENGSMNYIYKDVPGDFIEGGYLTTGNASIPEKTCNFISVLDNGITVIRRFDVSNERWIGMPWIIDTSNGTAGFTYTDGNRSTVAPWFEAAAEMRVSDVTESSLTLAFDQALDDELVNHYQVSVTDTFTGKPAVMSVKGLGAEKSVTGTFRALSRYYYRPNTMQFEISGLESGKVYSVAVYAVDDFGNVSGEPLTGSFRTEGTLSFPDVAGGTVLPEQIEDGKFFEMSFEDNLTDAVSGSEGTANGNVSFVDSYRADFGKAVSVGNGNGSYIDLGNRDEWNLGTDKDLTINFWIKVNSCSGYGSILSNKDWTNWWRKGINIAPEAADTTKLEFTLGDDVSWGAYVTGQVPQYAGSWHMMTFTIDRENQTARTYMDGILYKETSIAEIGDMTSGLNMLIGVDAGKAYGAIAFDMDELEMWDRPLSEEDIQTYYNVTCSADEIVAEGLYYAEYLLDRMEQAAGSRYYEEAVLQDLRDAIAAAKETASMETFLNLRDAVQAAENQPLRYLVQAEAVHGTVSPESRIVADGETAVFALTPDPQYEPEGCIITAGEGCTYRLEDDQLIVENLTSSTGIRVEFRQGSSTETEPEKADKSSLQARVDEAEAIDLSQYTAESAKTLQEALEKAKAVLADETLSADDQDKVEQAEAELRSAMEALAEAPAGGDDGEETGAGNENGTGSGAAESTDPGSKTDSPETGDASNGAVWLCGWLAAAGAAVLAVRKRKHMI